MKIPHSLRAVMACSIAALIASCGTDSKNTENKEQTVPADAAANEVLYMEGVYATSTLLPLLQHGVENVFDDDTATYWATAKGAGPDEGLMLYFPAKTYVKELSLKQATGDALARVNEVTVYADGQRVGSFDLSQPMKIDKDLTALFIKIASTDQSSTVDHTTEDDTETRSSETFDSRFSVGIADLKLFNSDGLLKIHAPLVMAGTVTASSTLKPADAYAPSMLFDSRKEFVWAEGAAGTGENEKLTFTFNADQRISSVKIWNGYQRSEKHFTSNARVRSFEFGLKNGSKTKYTIEDSMEPQLVTLGEPLTGKEFELTVLEAIPGSAYKDLVISEMVFFDQSRPVLIRDDSKAEASIQSLMAATRGSLMESFVDRRLKNHTETPYSTSDKSLILRSNKTFVLYEHTTSSDDAKEEDAEIVADGNWELVEQKDDYAKVRIFGKLINLSETVDYYKGKTQSSFVKIFQDNLTITPSEVKGEKFVDTFYNGSPSDL